MSLVDALNNIRIILARTQIALIVVGNAGTIPALVVFSQKQTRKSPFVMFLIAFLVSNLVTINYTILIDTLGAGFSIDFSIDSSIACQLKFYLALVFGSMPSFFLIMASFDRVLISSTDINVRMRSTRRFATILIVLIFIFWCTFHIPAFFFTNLIQISTNRRKICAPISANYSTFIIYYSLLVVSILPSVLLLILALKAHINMIDIRRRIGQHTLGIRIRQNDRHLIVLLLIQVSFYLVTHLPVICYSIYGETTKFIEKDANRLAIERLAQFVSKYMNFTHVALAPWINFLSKNFRNESKDMLRNIFLR